jgi:hypothetical protein
MRMLPVLLCLLPLLSSACAAPEGTVLGLSPAGAQASMGDLPRWEPPAKVLVTGEMVEK